MRLIPINCIKDQTILAKTIYNDNGAPLLKAGCYLNEHLIQKAIDNGISSLYIKDNYSKDVIKKIVNPQFRQKVVKSLKDSFMDIKLAAQSEEKGIEAYKSIQKVQDHVDNLRDLAEKLIEEIMRNHSTMLNLVDIKSMDHCTYEHSVNVAVLSIVTGIDLQMSWTELNDLAVGALLHDFGKVFVDKSILNKPSSLDGSEFDMMRGHPKVGYEYLEKYVDPISENTLDIVLHHHEREDGTGYPDSLCGDEINNLTKIAIICDVYDALTAERPYRKPITPNEAIEYLMGSCGSFFDITYVRQFIKRIVPYTVGSLVQLNDNRIAVVKKNNLNYPLRPVVDIIERIPDTSFMRFETVNLTEVCSLVIKGVYFSEKDKDQIIYHNIC
jgi:HD-GYP domain-containing protein (c-di-GMP phosphodiesterase class II)